MHILDSTSMHMVYQRVASLAALEVQRMLVEDAEVTPSGPVWLIPVSYFTMVHVSF